MPWLKPILPALLLAVMITLPGCACGSSSFLTGSSTKRAHCTDIGSLSLHSLKPPFITGNNKACFSALNPPAATTIIQALPFIISLLWQKASGFSDFLFSQGSQGSAVTELQKKIPTAPGKVFLPLTQDVVTDDDRVSLEKQFRELMENQQQLTEKNKNRSSIYIAMINEGLRAVVVPGQVIPEFLLNSIRHWLLDAELALYLQILPEADWLDLLPELQAIAAAGDDGDPYREPDNDPEPALFIAGEFKVQPWITGLYTEAVLQKQRLLGILRQRVRQAIASGNSDLARILLNRIMVIEADLSELKNAESQVSGNPAFQALLLKGLLENSGEVRTYATRNLAVEVPVDQKGSASGGGSAGSQNEPSEKKPFSGSDSKPGSSHHGSGSSGDNPEPEQLQHTYNKEFCPVCRKPVCKEMQPDSENPLGIGQKDYSLIIPTEILMHIFKYTRFSDRLSIMLCCKRFMQISKNEMVISSQVLVQFQGKLPDIPFPVGKSMSAVLEAKMGCPLNNVPPVAKQVLANYFKLAPSFCTHTLGLPEHEEQFIDLVDCVAAFPDDRIVSSSLDNMLRVWRIKQDGKGVCTHTLEGHTDPVTSVATLSDCWVISGSASGTIKIWNLNRPGENYCTDTFEAHTRSISFIETLPDRWFYSASFDDRVRVWFLTKEGRARHQHLLSVMGGVPVSGFCQTASFSPELTMDIYTSGRRQKIMKRL